MTFCRLAFLLAALSLAACGAPAPSGPRAGDYVGGTVIAECGPFARALSGVALYGEAADWWIEAGGHYARTYRPAEGSVLVLRRSNRLPSGHVAVVSRVLSSRRILVTQANWVRHRVSADQPVLDVSENNDWSVVRVWWPPAGDMGITDYAAFGFIRSDQPASHDQLVATLPRAIRDASGS